MSVTHLSILGGRTTTEAVGRMMDKVLPDSDVELKFNFIGSNDKKALKETELFHVLCSKICIYSIHIS